MDIREFRRITELAWVPDKLVVGGEDGSVRVYSSITWELQAVFREHTTGLNALVASPAGQFLFSASDHQLVAWSVDGFRKFAEFSEQANEVGPIKVEFTSGGYNIAISSEKSAFFVPSCLRRSVDELEISVRGYNCLKKADIKTMGELIEKTTTEMLKIKNFTRTALKDLEGALAGLTLNFGMLFPGQSFGSDIPNDHYVIDLVSRNMDREKKGRSPSKVSFVGDRPERTAYSSRDARIAVGTSDGRVFIWDAQTSMLLRELEQGKLDCSGMLLTNAKGLSRYVSDHEGTLHDWLLKRGAVSKRSKKSKPFSGESVPA